MIGALSNAVSGLQGAASRAEDVARDILRATTDTSASTEARAASESSTGQAGREGAGTTGTAPALTGDPVQPPPALQEESALERSFADLKAAEVSYKASAAVVKGITNTQDQLLDVLR